MEPAVGLTFGGPIAMRMRPDLLRSGCRMREYLRDQHLAGDYEVLEIALWLR